MLDLAKTTIMLTGSNFTSLAAIGQLAPFVWASGPFPGDNVASTGTPAKILSDTTASLEADCTGSAHAHFDATAKLCSSALTKCTNALPMSIHDTVGPVGSVVLNLSVLNYPSNVAIEGAVVTTATETKTVGVSGSVPLQVPANAPLEIKVVAQGYRHFLINRPILGKNKTTTYQLPNNTTIAALAGNLSVVDDPQKGILQVYVFAGVVGVPGGASPAVGTVVDIDAGFGTVLASDGNSPKLYTPGNKTIGTHVLFVNVNPGVVTPKITPPAGLTCNVGNGPVNVKAGTWTYTNVYCK